MGARQPVPREIAYTPSNIARGRLVVRPYLRFCRVLFCCTRTAGASSIRPSPRPLIGRGARLGIARAIRAARPRPLVYKLFDICESGRVLRPSSPRGFAGHVSPVGPCAAAPRVAQRAKRGAQGRDRTTDTAIFSRMLYQLSYLGRSLGPKKPVEPAVYRRHGQRCLPSRGDCFPYSCVAGETSAGSLTGRQSIEVYRLFDVVLIRLGGRDDIRAGEPAVEIDVATARRAEWADLLIRRPIADRAARHRLGGRLSGFR